jgi:hypothetical protein
MLYLGRYEEMKLDILEFLVLVVKSFPRFQDIHVLLGIISLKFPCESGYNPHFLMDIHS